MKDDNTLAELCKLSAQVEQLKNKLKQLIKEYSNE